MKAVMQDGYGPAERLELREVERPVPGVGEVLIRVHAAGVGAWDWHIMTGRPYVARLALGLRAPKVKIRGRDVAGTVEAVGQGVTRFAPGDAVFGTADGSFAEYTCAKEGQIARKPANLSFVQAAAVPIAAVTALQGLRDKGALAPGDRVLVLGAGGGVGTFAVQIARALGGHVTGVCSTAKVDLVRSLGAEEVIDYRTTDVTHSAERFDLILDNAGNRSLASLRRILTPGGRIVIVGGENGGAWLGGIQRGIGGMLRSRVTKPKQMMMMAVDRAADLETLTPMIESGAVLLAIDRTYPLDDVPSAIRHWNSGTVRGKVVVTVEG